ncbi:hypothetical protein AB0J74_27560 [Asanoa sp. NPDC049573]|uniref:hypothetical protein n=1 Tax=Asanoa sp. NPDC049573 TaxID=3155396 RepID=UPI00342AA873
MCRRLVAVLLALTLPGTAAACGVGKIAVAPLPIESAAATTAAAGPAPSSIAPPTAASLPSPRPPRSRPQVPPKPSPTPTLDASCFGPVRYELKIAETEFDLLKSLCFTAGGILRLQGIGPGLVTVDPDELVSSAYEAGVVDIVFLRPGTVEVTIAHADRIDILTVVMIR